MPPFADTAIDPRERPLEPPEQDGGGALRWVVIGVALMLLIVGAWRAYLWLNADVERRRALASQVVETVPHQPRGEIPPPPDAQTGRSTPPAQAADVPPAIAIPTPTTASNVSGVNKCVSNGQVTYTNAACPPDAEPAPVAVMAPQAGAAMDSGASPAPSTAMVGPQDGPDARRSACAYLSAEVNRLDFEFKQALPPPVIDHIATRMNELAAQQEHLGCTAPAAGARGG